jgi:hypothetical protein
MAVDEEQEEMLKRKKKIRGTHKKKLLPLFP